MDFMIVLVSQEADKSDLVDAGVEVAVVLCSCAASAYF
jgi:hypothetical protein